MKRFLLTGLSFALVGFWLFFSYGPGDWLPVVAFPPGADGLLKWATAGTAAVFVGVQVALLLAVRKFPGQPLPRAESGVAVSEMRVSRVVELFWTALPLALSVLLFWQLF